MHVCVAVLKFCEHNICTSARSSKLALYKSCNNNNNNNTVIIIRQTARGNLTKFTTKMHLETEENLLDFEVKGQGHSKTECD